MAYQVKRLSINARLLERWLLKVLLNLSFGQQLQLGISSQADGAVPTELVRICFGLQPFSGKSGMYVGAHNGMNMQMEEELRYSPLLIDGNRVVGGFFEVAGIHLFLSLDPNGPPPTFNEVEGIQGQWRTTQLRWQFREIQTVLNHRMSHVIRFNW